MKAGARTARFDPWAARGFEMAFLPLRRLLVGDVHVLNLPEGLPPGRPVLLAGNHISNWDGFLFREVQRRLAPSWPIYSLMLEEELRKRPLFRRLGGLGIDPRSPASVAGALREVRRLRRAGSDFFFSIFPQGTVRPAALRPLGFRGGIDLFLRALAPAAVIPAGIHMEPMRKLRPALFVSLGRPIQIDHPFPIRVLLESRVEAELARIQSLLPDWGKTGAPRAGGGPDPAEGPGAAHGRGAAAGSPAAAPLPQAPAL